MVAFRPAAVLLSAAATVAAGCGTSSPPEGCLTVPADTVARIADGSPTTPLDTDRAAARQTPEGFVVAVEFHTPGEDDPAVGVWWVPELNSPAMVTAVDALARSFTHWPHGPFEPGSREATSVANCIGHV
ncbi:hypothetical protein [Dietzia sp. 179-F 9C3 NHS]|uniref:hypothetical protein n=1 Tax=Dietzia sp. 179-F 9C3 NHS TaxID=3374295 RepID=UPI00387A63A6